MEEVGAFWDGTIKGLSSLRAALCRAVVDEVGGELLAALGAPLPDVQSFYDGISLALLMDAAAGGSGAGRRRAATEARFCLAWPRGCSRISCAG